MLIPVPLEVMSMLQMFKTFSENNKNSSRSPLLEMLLPHFEEIFDEIDVETVVLTTQSQNTDFKNKNQRKDIVENGNRRIRYRIQGVVTVSEGESDPLPDLLTGLRAVTAIIVEWKSSPTGNPICFDVQSTALALFILSQHCAITLFTDICLTFSISILHLAPSSLLSFVYSFCQAKSHSISYTAYL